MVKKNNNRSKAFRWPGWLRFDLAQAGSKQGIQWVGRNEDGVPMWAGTWRSFPKWFTLLFKCLGIGLLCLAAIFASIGLWQAVPGPAIAGTVHTTLGFVVFERLKRKLDAAMTADEAAKQLGVEEAEFERVVEEKGVLPTHLFNDEPVYNLESFGEVGTLLRATERPEETNQTLLRAAGNVPDESTDRLLRAVDEEARPKLPVTKDHSLGDKGLVENSPDVIRLEARSDQ